MGKTLLLNDKFAFLGGDYDSRNSSGGDGILSDYKGSDGQAYQIFLVVTNDKNEMKEKRLSIGAILPDGSMGLLKYSLSDMEPRKCSLAAKEKKMFGATVITYEGTWDKKDNVGFDNGKVEVTIPKMLNGTSYVSANRTEDDITYEINWWLGKFKETTPPAYEELMKYLKDSELLIQECTQIVETKGRGTR